METLSEYGTLGFL
uniref:Uncharacterized protein n=1 Tax=Arundo donax TaxID=35708 RepID=A0A0A9AUH2_ARUDO